MKALERYVKKTGKASPYKDGEKSSGKTLNAPSGGDSDQVAKTGGDKANTSGDDETTDEETSPSSAGSSAFQSVKSNGKKKQRSYLKA